MDRRLFLAGGGAALLAGAASNGQDGRIPRSAGAMFAPAAVAADATTPFSAETVKQMAEQLAQKAYEKPKIELPPPYGRLGYDQYRDVRFRTEQSIWRGQGLDFELQLFPMGWLFDVPVDLFAVEDGQSRQLNADAGLFKFGPLVGPPPATASIGFSGFRIHGPLNRPDYFDEVAVFQGASYFRAVARGQVYGLSARGLALNTARPGGEEFPMFRAFWIERPKAGSQELVVHALLDSVSVSGAYRFSIRGGAATLMEVSSTLYPRRDLHNVGIAPLTSMFLFGSNNRRGSTDFRPAVHDSEGLAVLNGNGERLWRALNNPKRLQLSAFLDKDPKGFGLLQRDRSFAAYEDLEARYERRPSLWVEPIGDWGHGNVELIEIPTDEEIHDNIVAFWRPAEPLAKGRGYEFNYRLHWGDQVPFEWSGAYVKKTRIGMNKKTGTSVYIVDFVGPGVQNGQELPIANLTASAGQPSAPIVHANPEVNGVRVQFELDPKGEELCELRLTLRNKEKRISEVWLYRWTRD